MSNQIDNDLILDFIRNSVISKKSKDYIRTGLIRLLDDSHIKSNTASLSADILSGYLGEGNIIPILRMLYSKVADKENLATIGIEGEFSLKNWHYIAPIHVNRDAYSSIFSTNPSIQDYLQRINANNESSSGYESDEDQLDEEDNIEDF